MSEILGFLDVNDYGLQSMVAGAGKMQDKTATPTTSQQIIEPDQGYDGMSSVTVNAVTSAIDENIIPTNIRSGKTILGVQGNLEPDKPDQSKTVNPSTSQQVVVADTGYELAQVTVNAMNLQSKDISISTNGTTTIEADQGYDGLSDVDVTVSGILDTSDANATAGDIVKDKTAYVNGSKITGNINALTTWEGGADTYSKLGTEGMYVMLNGSSVGRMLIKNTSSFKINLFNNRIATTMGITASQIKKDEVIFGVTGTYEGASLVLPVGQSISFAYSFMNNPGVAEPMKWFESVDTHNLTSTAGMFQACHRLKDPPFFDTSNVTNMSNMFFQSEDIRNVPTYNTSNCTNFSQMFRFCENNLKVPPILNTSKATNMYWMFANCYVLSNEGLNNILAMCIGATAYIQQGTDMTLKQLGLSQTQATTCQTLSNWNDFVAAGWRNTVTKNID